MTVTQTNKSHNPTYRINIEYWNCGFQFLIIGNIEVGLIFLIILGRVAYLNYTPFSGLS